MVQVFINRNFIDNLMTSDIETQTYVFNLFQNLAPYKLTLDISSEELYKLTNNYPMIRGLTSPLMEYRFLPYSITNEYIEQKHLPNTTLETKFFFVDAIEKTCIYYQNNYGLFVTNTDCFIDHFNRFFLNSNRSWEENEFWIGIAKEKNPKPLNWSDIASRITVSQFYLISDRYCFNTENLENTKHNLACLIAEIIASLPPKLVPLFYINTIIKSPSKESPDAYKDILAKMIQEKTTRMFNLTVFNFSLNLKKKFQLDDHTRFIASNYFFLHADQSFNFFDQHGNPANITCKIENSFRFAPLYGYYFTDNFFNKFKKMLSKVKYPVERL